MTAINQDMGPDPAGTGASGARSSRRMSRYELHSTFREMVCWELSNGRLSAWRRRKLVRYAASLRLSAVEAGELIQEAIRAQEPPNVQVDAWCDAEPSASSSDFEWPAWAKLSIVLAAVILVNVILATVI